MATRMQQRRGTAAQWTAANPVLAAGEIGFETDTNQFKIGDGSTAWSSLSFFKNLEDLGGLDDFVMYSEIGDASDPANYTRTAPLNEDGLIPLAYMAKLVEGSEANLDTFAELGSAIDQLNQHAEATSGIHGISDTADLAYVTDPRFSDERTPEDLSVVTGKIAESAVTSTKIADDAVGTVKIADSAVTTSKINDGNVTAAKLGTDSVTNVKIQNDAVTTDKIQDDAVTSAKIIAGAVGPTELASYAVETAKIDDLAVTEAKIADDAVTSSKIADESVTGSKIADNSISQSHLTDDSVGTNEIGGLAVTTEKIASLAVTTGKIDDLAVTTGKLNNLSVTTGKIDDLAVTSEKIADSAVGTDQLVDANVTEAKLANDSVTSLKLADDAVQTVHIVNANVTEAKLATGSVTNTKLADDAVTAVKVLDGSIGSTKLATDAVETEKIADGAVTSEKIADGTIVNANISNTAAISQSKISGLSTTLDAKADLASPTFTGTVAGITKSMVGLGSVDNTSDASKPVSTATQTALDLKANLAGPTFTGTVVLPSTTSIGNVSATELGYVDGVTSAIQTQIDDKLSKSGGTMTGDLTLAGAPTSDLHAATKAYVDNVSAGINFHQPVRVATTGNITLSGTQTIDGVALSVGDRVLVKDQTDQKTNGIYVVASSTWSRATDADNNPSGELAGGDFSLVLEGTVNSGYGYVCSNTSAITVGTTNVTYAAFNAAKAITAGSGLTESTPGTLDIATGGVTSAMIADGTIVNADINASAAIDQSKISGLSTALSAKAPLASPTFTGTVTVASAGIAFTDGTQTKEGTPSRTYIYGATNSNAKAANYTLSSLAERDSLIEVSAAATITIPTDATIDYPIGTSIDILQTGTGTVTVAPASVAVTVNATPGLTLRTQWSSATLFKRGANTWVVYGDLK